MLLHTTKKLKTSSRESLQWQHPDPTSAERMDLQRLAAKVVVGNRQ